MHSPILDMHYVTTYGYALRYTWICITSQHMDMHYVTTYGYALRHNIWICITSQHMDMHYVTLGYALRYISDMRYVTTGVRLSYILSNSPIILMLNPIFSLMSILIEAQAMFKLSSDITF